jgi:hypothetical protein
MKKALKQLVLFYLLIVVVIEVSGYVVTKFGYMSGAMSKFVSESGFYAVALFMPLLFGWIFFGASHVLIRKCRNCGSKNIRLGLPRTGFVCDDCDHALQLSLPRDTKMLILLFAVPFLLLGPCLSLGSILAGETMPINIIRTSILFSTWIPLFLATLLYVGSRESPFFNEHQALGFALICVIIFAFGFGLFVYDRIIRAILETIL